MDRFVLNVLLVEDDQDIRHLIKEIIEDVNRERTDVILVTSEAGTIDEAIAATLSHPPLLVITDLHLPSVERKQIDLLEFLSKLRKSLTTYNSRVIVESGRIPASKPGSSVSQITAEQRELLRRFKELRVNDTISKPFDPFEMMQKIDAIVTSILDQRTTSTGLLGRTEADRLLTYVIETDQIPTVALMLDLRKIGLAANDRFGREFGNSIIDLFAQVSTEEIDKKVKAIQEKSGFQVEHAHFQMGGDEFAIVLRTPEESSLPNLTRDAEWLGRAIQTHYRKKVQQAYPRQYHSEYGLLVGPGVTDKSGQHIVLPLPSPRVAVVPFYEGVYSQLADVAAVELYLQAQMKREGNATEAQANALFRLPAREFPGLPKGELQELLQIAHRLLAQPKDMWTANSALADQILRQRTEAERNK